MGLLCTLTAQMSIQYIEHVIKIYSIWKKSVIFSAYSQPEIRQRNLCPPFIFPAALDQESLLIPLLYLFRPRTNNAHLLIADRLVIFDYVHVAHTQYT
jgi:hypothetical protein